MDGDSANPRKRSLEDVDEESGVAAALRRAQDETLGDAQNGWQVVDGSMKKRRLNKKKKKAQKAEKKVSTPDSDHNTTDSTKPVLEVSPLHKLQRCLRVYNLQSLVLYCIADGVAPHWISVRNRSQVRKAVVLMVPGLESAMLTGGLNLEDSPAAGSADGPGTDSESDSDESNEAKNEAEGRAEKETQARPATKGYLASSKNPDDFLPVALEADSLPPALKPLGNIFPQMWPVKAPGDDKFCKLHSPQYAMLTSVIPRSQESKKAKGPHPLKGAATWVDERTPITNFIASRDELRENDYIPHPSLYAESEKTAYAKLRYSANALESDGWRDLRFNDLSACDVPNSEIEEGSMVAGRTVLAVDCEMCIVEGGEYALTRISVVNWDGEVVLDEFVKPDKPITDYLTAFSGISAKSLENESTGLKDIQEKLLTMCHSKTILVGHSLESDLKALKITHPFIVDTTMIYPHPRGPPLKSSLKFLAQKYLSREIQKGDGTLGHDSVEDARACLDLVKQKCERGPKWGLSESSGEPIFKRLLRTPKPGSSAPAGQPREGRIGAIVDHGAPERNFGSTASFSIGCESDAEVVAGVKRAVLGDEDGAEIPSGGVDFTFARFRELETLRGWTHEQRFSKGSSDGAPLALCGSSLGKAVVALVDHISAIRTALPPCTLFIVYSGNGDPRDLVKLQEQQRTFKKEYAFKKWDELSVQWTDVEEQALKAACKKARNGIGFICMT